MPRLQPDGVAKQNYFDYVLLFGKWGVFPISLRVATGLLHSLWITHRSVDERSSGPERKGAAFCAQAEALGSAITR